MQNEILQQNYASLNQRVLAAVIDLILAAIITLPLLIFFYGSQLLISPYLFEGTVSILLISIILPAILLSFWTLKGATPGKLLLRIRIVDAQLVRTPSIKQCLIRFLGYFIAPLTLGISILMMLINPRHQTLHDKLANTVVVKINLNAHQELIKPTLIRKASYWLTLIFSSLLIISATTLGLINLVLIPTGYLPAEKLYTDVSTPEYARQVLYKNKILDEDKYILLFHPNGSFFSSSGSILINDRVITYWTSQEGIQIDQALYTEIKKVEMIQSEILFENSIIVLTTDATTLQLYVSRYNNFDLKFLVVLENAIQISKTKQRKLEQL